MTFETETAERIHTCYLFSVISFCVSPSHKNEAKFSGENLLERMKGGGSFNWDEINSAFPKVWARTLDYAQRHGIDPKSREAAVGYWLLEHNRLIKHRVDEYQEMPLSYREACQTRLARVVKLVEEVLGIQKLEVLDDTGTKRQVMDYYYGNLKPGDYISFHEFIICQRMNENEYNYLLEKRKEYEQ